MSKVILKQMLETKRRLSRFEVDSAAHDRPTYEGASTNAREAIKRLFGDDLLASHKAKRLSPELVQWADLILVMAARMKVGLPQGKTWTLKEYAGESGDIADPFGGSLDTYLKCANEISSALVAILPKLE
jgi:protein-tyrosine phosphatase